MRREQIDDVVCDDGFDQHSSRRAV